VSTIDQQFIEFVVKSLVSNPDAVKVERRIDEKGVLLELTVDPEDLGRVIGKRGATAQSIRTLLRALGTKNDARYNLKIVDNGEPRREDTRDRRPEPKPEPAEESPSAKASEDAVAEEPAEEPKEEESGFRSFADEEPAKKEEDDVVSKTRRELADLDDLDV
jgi:predicted RNA-binding protein YlqC (UPF0109 family)